MSRRVSDVFRDGRRVTTAVIRRAWLPECTGPVSAQQHRGSLWGSTVLLWPGTESQSLRPGYRLVEATVRVVQFHSDSGRDPSAWGACSQGGRQSGDNATSDKSSCGANAVCRQCAEVEYGPEIRGSSMDGPAGGEPVPLHSMFVAR